MNGFINSFINKHSQKNNCVHSNEEIHEIETNANREMMSIMNSDSAQKIASYSAIAIKKYYKDAKSQSKSQLDPITAEFYQHQIKRFNKESMVQEELESIYKLMLKNNISVDKYMSIVDKNTINNEKTNSDLWSSTLAEVALLIKNNEKDNSYVLDEYDLEFYQKRMIESAKEIRINKKWKIIYELLLENAISSEDFYQIEHKYHHKFEDYEEETDKILDDIKFLIISKEQGVTSNKVFKKNNDN